MTTQLMNQDRPGGAVAAALVAGGLGSATIGLMTILAEALSGVKDALNWWDPAGPLVGKTGVGVIVFLISWIVLHFIFRNKEVNMARMTVIALVLLGFGLLGTFPPFFGLFAAE